MLVLVLCLMGCAPRTPVVATPVGGPDGTVLVSDQEVRLALLGDLGSPESVLADVRDRSAALVVVTGDAVDRGRPAAWAELVDALGGMPTVVIPGDGERKRDPQLNHFTRTWSGLGVRGVDQPVPWRHVDVLSRGIRWRLVVVDSDRDALGDRWRDQLFWLPKALGGDYERLVVVTNHSTISLAEGFEERRGPAELMELVREHAPPAALVAWLAGGEGTMELLLPTGRWDQAVVVAGCSDRDEATTLRRSVGPIALPLGMQSALLEEFTRWRARGGFDPTPISEGADFEVPSFPVCGWWEAGILGDNLRLTLRMRGYRAGWSDVWSADWAPDSGWQTEPPP